MSRQLYRSGYTLLEVILAMTIAMVLLAALYKTLNLHLRTAQWGPRAVQREQLARAMSEQLRRDLAHLVIPRDGGAVMATNQEIPGQTQRADRYSGLRGDRQWIEFFTDQPSVDTDLTSTTPVGISRIRYEITPSAPTVSGGRGKSEWSLTRTQVTAEFAEKWDAGNFDAARWARTDVLSDSIAWMQFQFWDRENSVWVDSWQPLRSVTRPATTVPAAVRLTFRLPDLSAERGGVRDGIAPFHRLFFDLTGEQSISLSPGPRDSVAGPEGQRR